MKTSWLWGEFIPPNFTQFKFKQVIHTSCPKSWMVTRGRSSSSSPSLQDAPRVGVFSGHPLLVALKAAQIIKVINKGPLCFAPDYIGACGNNSIMSRQGLVKSSDWNKDVSCLDKSWAVSGRFGAHFTPPGAVSHRCKVSLSPELSNPPLHPFEVP